MELAPRNRVCMSCRIGLLPDEACDIDVTHPIAELQTVEGRESLVNATWGPPIARHAQQRALARRERAATVAALGWFSAGATALLLGIPLLGPAEVISGAGVFSAIGFFWARTPRRSEGSYPTGGTDRLQPPQSGPRGAASGHADAQAPASGAACLAFCLELRHISRGAERLLYRDSITTGFDVALDTGGLARIPPGRIHLSGASRQVVDFDNRDVAMYLRQVDPGHDPDARFDPLRYSVIFEQLLLPGQRVELLSRFEPRVARTLREGGYRDPALSHLAPVGVPFVRIMSDGSR